MTTITEGRHTGEFIGELAMGPGYHMDPVTIVSGQNLVAGAVVGKITASGKYQALATSGTTGAENAAGILFGAVNASAADTAGVVLLRGPALVNATDLTWPAGISGPQKTAAIAALLALGIKVS